MTMEEKMDKLTFEEKMMIKQTLSEFDFGKVHKVMIHLKWRWHNKGVPTIDQLQETAKKHCVSAIVECKEGNHKEFRISSGGFTATYYAKTEEDEAIVFLDFVVEESNSEFWNDL